MSSFHDSGESYGSRRRYASMGGDKYILFYEKNKGSEAQSPMRIEALSDPEKSYSMFLKRHTCYDLIPLSAKLVVFDVGLNVKKAFFALVYNGVRVAILWDSAVQRHVGMLTITDFIRILHQYYRSPTSPMSELEEHQIKTWREQLTEYQRPFVYITPEKTLLDAVHMLLEHKVHRLPVIDPASGNPLHILTHKRVLKYLHINIGQLPRPSFMGKKLRDLKLGTLSGVVVVQQDCPLNKALQHFIEHRVSALPVVDSDGHLVDIYAKFDVINLAATRTYHNLDISVYDALNYRRGKFQGVATCVLDDTLEAIVDRIVNAGVHRLVIVEAEKVIGVISLSDLLRFLVSVPELASPAPSSS